MTYPRTFKLALVTSVLALAAGPLAAAEEISLRMSWLMNVQGAGYVMADKKGFFAEEGLDVEIMAGGPNLNSMTLVATGQNTFGTNDVSSVLFGKSEGMPLAIVGACFQRNPAGVLSLEKTGIKEPGDLVGKSLAFNEGGPWVYTQAMLAAAGVDISKVNTVTVIGNEVLMSGQVDAKTAFVVNEPIALQLQGFDTSVLVAADYGIQAYAETIVTTEDYLAENPETVAGFMRAVAKGWEYALSNQDEAVQAVLALNTELDPEQQRRQLAMQESFIRSDATAKNGLCSVTTEAVADSAEILAKYGGLKAEGLDIEALVHEEFNVGM